MKMSDQDKFNVILKFLKANPDAVPGKNISDKKAYIDDEDNQKKLREKFETARSKPFVFKVSETVPDPAVSKILEYTKGYDESELEKITLQHKESMAAENIIGGMLEAYISSELEDDGWINTSGNTVKAVDFIKDNGDGTFQALQIKNRDNTENSSSSAIRENTTIDKWHRTFAHKEGTNWEAFPETDESIKKKLNEEGFQKFIQDNLKK
jgi:hypothetical protein